MAKRRIRSAFFQSAVSAPGILQGETSLSEDKFKEIEMYTGLEGGMLSIYFKGSEILVPLMNIKSMVVKQDLAHQKMSA